MIIAFYCCVCLVGCDYHAQTQEEERIADMDISSPIGGMLYPCLIPSHKAKRVPRSTHPRTKIQMLAMIGTGVMVIAREIDQKFRIRSDGREGSLTRSHGTHSSFFTIPKSPQQEAGGLWWCPLFWSMDPIEQDNSATHPPVRAAARTCTQARDAAARPCAVSRHVTFADTNG
jgi:hypothetical protein